MDWNFLKDVDEVVFLTRKVLVMLEDVRTYERGTKRERGTGGYTGRNR